MKKILVVDDEVAICNLVRYRLEKEGYKVITANCGREALGIAKTEHPDLVILDIMMPEMDGFEVLDCLKKDFKNDIPVVFLSAKASDDDIWEGWQSGVDCYITKPFSAPTLLNVVASCLKKAS